MSTSLNLSSEPDPLDEPSEPAPAIDDGLRLSLWRACAVAAALLVPASLGIGLVFGGGFAAIAASVLVLYTALALILGQAERASAGWVAIVTGIIGLPLLGVGIALGGPGLVWVGLGPQLAFVAFANVALIVAGCGLEWRIQSAIGACPLIAILGTIAFDAWATVMIVTRAALPARRARLEARADLERGIAVQQTLKQLSYCLMLYGKRTGGAYPATLDGLATEGRECAPDVVPRVAAGVRVTYSVKTTPDGPRGFELAIGPPADASGSARDTSPYHTDETGVVWRQANETTRAARGEVPELIRAVERCVREYRERSPTTGYPSRLDALVGRNDGCRGWRGTWHQQFLAVSGGWRGYRYTVTPTSVDERGAVTAYRIDARPARFGRPFTRSYMCDLQGRLRFTDVDRAAEHTDANLELDVPFTWERPYYCVGGRPALEQPEKASAEESARARQANEVERARYEARRLSGWIVDP